MQMPKSDSTITKAAADRAAIERWEGETAMLAGLPYTALRDAILTHPTMAEGLNVLFANVVDAARRG